MRMNKAKSRSNLNLNKCIYAIINDQMEFRIGLVGKWRSGSERVRDEDRAIVSGKNIHIYGVVCSKSNDSYLVAQ